MWTGTRIKEARGQAKSNLMSHVNMVDEHGHYPDADVLIEIDKTLPLFTAHYYDDDGLIYSIEYKVEVTDA